LKVDKLLAATLGLILVAGFGMPALAEDVVVNAVENPEIVSTAELLVPSNSDDIVFETPGDPELRAGANTDKQIILADFILDEKTVITDFHFVFFNDPPWDGTMKYFVYSDDGGPDEKLAFGDGQMVEMELISGDSFMTWFDLEDPITLDADTKFWFGLHTSETFGGDSGFRWSESTEVFEETICVFLGDENAQLSCASPGEVWFQLSGHPPEIVGGELLSIDSTALILAGAQTFSWMIPVVLSVLGIGLFVVSRKSE